MEQQISIEKKTIQEDMTYHGKVILTYRIHYPQFQSIRFQRTLNRINSFYRAKANAFAAYCRTKLFRQAVEQFEYSKKHQYPIMKYEAVVDYEVTFQQDCTLSLYYDQYTYTGGAHGSTVRKSDTWDLKTGQNLPMRRFFSRYLDYRNYVIKSIIAQIEQQNQNGQGTYFEDYETNVMQEMNINSFYLVPEGVMVYFQQYDIAPYSSGIVEFLIPFVKGMVYHPTC